MGDGVYVGELEHDKRGRVAAAVAWVSGHLGRALTAAGVVLVALAILGWLKAPDLYGGVLNEQARVQAVVTTRASVLAALAGAGALATIGINLRNSRTNAQTLRTTQETFRVTERGHLTERYTKAIEQLGNETSVAIRLGGIYALQQLAVDTSRDGDQATIVEVLSAFVRLNLHIQDGGPVSAFPPTGTDAEGAPDETPKAEPRADVLAAISVLAQLPNRPAVPMRADFTGLDFSLIILSNARLVDANLSEVRLAGANLTNANLARARLVFAGLSGANLTDATLSGATLIGAHLAGATLAGADFSTADLTSAELNSANLARARLVGADFTNANLTGANLTEAILGRSAFTGADLTGADLTGANLAGADFTAAELAGADVSEASGLTAQLARVRSRPRDPSPTTPSPAVNGGSGTDGDQDRRCSH